MDRWIVKDTTRIEKKTSTPDTYKYHVITIEEVVGMLVWDVDTHID